MRGIKIPQQDFALKMLGGLMREGGDVFAGHYGNSFHFTNKNIERFPPFSLYATLLLCDKWEQQTFSVVNLIQN